MTDKELVERISKSFDHYATSFEVDGRYSPRQWVDEVVFSVNLWLRAKKAMHEVHQLRGAKVTEEDGTVETVDAWEDMDFVPLQISTEKSGGL